MQQIHQMTKKGPRSLIGTVVDASYHVTMGYVYCTTELGYVNVYGVPFGSVVPQMRIYVRQQGAQSSNRAFVFDGYAPSVSSLSQSGSLLYSALSTIPGARLLGNTTASLAAASSLTTAVGYYWHCFFYLAALPTTLATIFCMWTGSTSNAINLELLSSGQLRFRSYSDSKGYLSNSVIAPHAVHFVVIQPGLTGLEMIVDGITSYTGLSAGATPTFAGGTNLYTLVTLTDSFGNTPVPLGSWMSKFGFGMSYASGSPVALAFGNTPPQSDSDIPNLNSGATMQTSALYLCNDTPGGISAGNTATGSSASSLTLTSGICAVSALGPY
jgi:hypothetical protein